MSALGTAMARLRQMVAEELGRREPFRAIVTDTDGDLTYIRRLETSIADAEPYAKATADTLVVDDEVLCWPVAGKPVIVGKVRRTPAA